MIAANVVVELNDKNFPTALIDAEPDFPTAKRLLRFDPQLVAVAAHKLEEIQDSTRELKAKGYNIVIDTPGNDSEQLTAVCLLSDVLIIPMQTAEQDLIQTKTVLTLVRTLQMRTGGAPLAYLVFTQTSAGDLAATQLRKDLAPLDIPIANTQIRSLKKYQRNISVMRDPKLNTAGEADDIRALLDELVMPHLKIGKGVANG